MRVRRERRLAVPVGFDVTRLGPREREVLAAHQEGMSLREIAEHVGVSYEAAKKALQRVERRFERYRRSPGYRRAVAEQQEGLAVSLRELYGAALGRPVLRG